jgi:hypothetical protein
LIGVPPFSTAVPNRERAMTHTQELASMLETSWVELIDRPSLLSESISAAMLATHISIGFSVPCRS